MRALLLLVLLPPAAAQDSRPAAATTTRAEPATVHDRRPVPEFAAPADAPRRADLVFCAFGSHGTGLAGQKRVAEAVARLAPTGPLDFVLLLGDNVMPDGVRTLDDPLWESRFEEVYDRRKLDLPFYAVVGDADHRGDIKMQIDYGRLGRRWTMPNYVFDFRVVSHGKTLHFFGADTTSMIGDIGNPQNRIANRLLVHAIQNSQADWKIVFGHQPMFSGGSEHESAASLKLRERLAYFLKEFKVDVYLAGGERALELRAPVDGTTHVLSGGGGGPDVAESTRQRPETVFAHTGGGFTWWRFDGKELELSFRDADGKVLFVHRLRK